MEITKKWLDKQGACADWYSFDKKIPDNYDNIKISENGLLKAIKKIYNGRV